MDTSCVTDSYLNLCYSERTINSCTELLPKYQVGLPKTMESPRKLYSLLLRRLPGVLLLISISLSQALGCWITECVTLERREWISYKWYIMSKCLNRAVSKLMIVKVLAVIFLLGRKSGSSWLRFSSFAYQEGTSLCQDASFKPSTIKIDLGVRPVDVRKKKGKRRNGWENVLKRYRSKVVYINCNCNWKGKITEK